MFSFHCIIVHENLTFESRSVFYLSLIHFAKKVEGEDPKNNSQKLKTDKDFLPLFLLGRICQGHQSKTVILQKSLSRYMVNVPILLSLYWLNSAVQQINH